MNVYWIIRFVNCMCLISIVIPKTPSIHITFIYKCTNIKWQPVASGVQEYSWIYSEIWNIKESRIEITPLPLSTHTFTHMYTLLFSINTYKNSFHCFILDPFLSDPRLIE